MPRFLTVREANFAVKFVETGEARAAAIKIGVSPASAAQVGYRMMKRQRVRDEIARVRAINDAHESLVADRALAHVLRHGAMPGFAQGHPRAVALVEGAISDPDVVRAAAIAVGMIPTRVSVVCEGGDGEPLRLEVRELYEAVPQILVRAASLLDKKLARRVDRLKG